MNKSHFSQECLKVIQFFRFEIWQNVGGLSSVVADDQNANKSDIPEINFRFHRVVDIDDCDDYCLVGQVRASSNTGGPFDYSRTQTPQITRETCHFGAKLA